jgi:filamentous hemagglutinin
MCNRIRIMQANNKWREGGTYRAAGHFVIGGLGGGSAGALASGGISLAADKLNSLQDELKDKLIELGMSPDTAQMFSQGAGMATAGTLGTAAGGTVGGGSAFNTDTNNRQLHFEEKERIKIASGGDKEKQARLTKAACFEVKCWAQFPEGSDLYKANYVSVAEMSSLQTEWDWVKGQKDFGAFNYTPSQKFTDWVASKTGLASGTFGGKPIGSGGSNTQSCATAECVAGLMPAPSEMRSVEQIDRDLRSGVCKSLVGNVVNTLVPGSLVLRPILDSAGKAIGWAIEKGFDKSTSNASGSVICKG